MVIKYAILGLLSRQDMSGYDLKKVFENSSYMHWSGNNNQIYKSLVQLLEEGLAVSRTVHQEGAPTKKLYSITPTGIHALKSWVLSPPEAPEMHKTFLIQLSCADILDDAELQHLLHKYEEQLESILAIETEKRKRGVASSGRTPRESYLLDMVLDNTISAYKTELLWAAKLKKGLEEKIYLQKEENVLDYKYMIKNGVGYIECCKAARVLESEQDALDLVGVCGENGTSLLMVHSEALSEDFFRLRTGIAGRMLQKFTNYSLKTAAVIPSELTSRGKFKDMMLEANRGKQFRIFDSRDEAEEWLIGGA